MTSTDDQTIDATGRVAFTGDQPHPYRTNTRFRNVDGKWEPIEEQRSAQPEWRQTTPEERAAGRKRASIKIEEESKPWAKSSRQSRRGKILEIQLAALAKVKAFHW